jgi:hypothetical protein
LRVEGILILLRIIGIPVEIATVVVAKYSGKQLTNGDAKKMQHHTGK